MLVNEARTLLLAILLAMPAAALAIEPIPVETFAQLASLSMPRLSPDGQYLALRMADDSNGTHALVVYKISDMSAPVSLLRLPKYELPANIIWVSSTRLIVEKGKIYGSIDRPELTGEILATDIDGKHQDYLYGFEAGKSSRTTRARDLGWGFYAGQPHPANGHFYMTSQNWGDDSKSELYDVDATKNLRHLIGEIGVEGMTFLVGPDGQTHFAYGENADYQYVVYHREPSGWTQLGAEQIGRSFAPIGFTPDHLGIYAHYAADGGPTSLVQQSDNGSDRKVLAKSGFGSIGSIQWTALPRQPFATVEHTGVPVAHYIDPALPEAKLHAALSLKFPGSFVTFIDFSEDGGQLVFGVSSDRSPGSYYLIDTHTYKVRRLFDAAPWVDPSQMAERRPLRFKASDGTELEAILTLPKGASETHLPMILLPHGGPFDAEDDWYYDNDAQFLASRGYLVLQVNYRGSGGRGSNFKTAGYLKWGTRIQQDLIDGVKWAVDQSYADPKRICVFGGSFGGYAAMMTVIRSPGTFKCAVGYAGVYDLPMMYAKGDISATKSGRSYLTTVIGKDDADLAANSPDRLADKIDVPVLLVHGEDDQRAPFAQAKAMRAALEAAHKPYEWLSKPGEGHGFYSEKDNVEFLNRLQAFLEKNIGKGA